MHMLLPNPMAILIFDQLFVDNVSRMSFFSMLIYQFRFLYTLKAFRSFGPFFVSRDAATDSQSN